MCNKQSSQAKHTGWLDLHWQRLLPFIGLQHHRLLSPWLVASYSPAPLCSTFLQVFSSIKFPMWDCWGKERGTSSVLMELTIRPPACWGQPSSSSEEERACFCLQLILSSLIICDEMPVLRYSAMFALVRHLYEWIWAPFHVFISGLSSLFLYAKCPFSHWTCLFPNELHI